MFNIFLVVWCDVYEFVGHVLTRLLSVGLAVRPRRMKCVDCCLLALDVIGLFFSSVFFTSKNGSYFQMKDVDSQEGSFILYENPFLSFLTG